MLEKLKQYLGYVYAALIAIGAALLYSLSKKNSSLESQVGHLKAENDIRDTVMKKEQAEKEADNEEDAYRMARDEFIRKNGSGDGNEQ